MSEFLTRKGRDVARFVQLGGHWPAGDVPLWVHDFTRAYGRDHLGRDNFYWDKSDTALVMAVIREGYDAELFALRNRMRESNDIVHTVRREAFDESRAEDSSLNARLALSAIRKALPKQVTTLTLADIEAMPIEKLWDLRGKERNSQISVEIEGFDREAAVEHYAGCLSEGSADRASLGRYSDLDLCVRLREYSVPAPGLSGMRP